MNLPSPQYDPKIIEAVRRSNELDDAPDEKIVIGAPTPDNIAGARAFLTAQDRQKLRNLLPGMSDTGLDQLKRNVRVGVGVPNSSGLRGLP